MYVPVKLICAYTILMGKYTFTRVGNACAKTFVPVMPKIPRLINL